MDEAETRKCVHEHAEGAQLPQIAQTLPQPVTSAEVVSLEVGDSESVAVIRYTGDSSELTLRSHWQDQDGRPMIVAAEPVS